MRASSPFDGRILLLFGLFVAAGCAGPASRPQNLSTLKREIWAYVESGKHGQEIDAVAAEARAWIAARAARGGDRLTVVFDLDETLLDNGPHLRAMDLGYVVPEWDRWVDEGKAPAIASVREVYREARRRGVDVVYITGRAERGRAGTERNLRAIDCADYVALICKPDAERGSSAAFKTAARKKLVSEGRTIIANIGDQESDLLGGFAERTFKLPNVFYLTE
jgi:predicted secreted acid phosphatase